MAHVCPIDGNKVNKPAVRIVAAWVVLISVAGIATQSFIPFVFLMYDFFVRGFLNRNGSLLRWLAINIVNVLDIQPQLIDNAPKRFAAKIGFIFSAILVVLALLNIWIPFFIVGGILVSCAILESVFSYCVGCEVFALLVRFNLIPVASK